MLHQGNAKWGEMLAFDLQLQNVPRMARLCFVLYMLPDKRIGKKTPTARKLMDKKKVTELNESWIVSSRRFCGTYNMMHVKYFCVANQL